MLESHSRKVLLVTSLLFTAGWGCMPASRSGDSIMRGLGDLAPRHVLGWQAEGEDALYDRESVFDYMDGGAELYLAYGLDSLLVRTFSWEGHPTLTAELYRMGSSADAFGVFSLQQVDPEVGIGQGSELGGGILRFWRDRYFGQIYSDGDQDVGEVLRELGGRIAAAVGSDGALPDLVRLLPPEGQEPGSVSYFRHHVCLNYRFFVASRDILGLGEGAEGVIADYYSHDHPTRLLLVRYPGASRAEANFDRFLTAYLPEAKGGGPVRTEDGRWTGARREGAYVIVVFEAESENSAWGLLDETAGILTAGGSKEK